MSGIGFLLMWIAILLGNEGNKKEMILNFKDVYIAGKFFIIVVMGIAGWGIVVNSFWQNAITIEALVAFINDAWFVIVIFLLTISILIENILKKPLFYIKNKKIRNILCVIIIVLEIVIIGFDLAYL